MRTRIFAGFRQQKTKPTNRKATKGGLRRNKISSFNIQIQIQRNSIREQKVKRVMMIGEKKNLFKHKQRQKHLKVSTFRTKREGLYIFLCSKCTEKKRRNLRKWRKKREKDEKNDVENKS